MEHGQNQTQPEPKMEVEELSEPQQAHEIVEIPFVNPLVENIMAQMNTPQQCGEPDDIYHHHHDAAVQLHHVTFERTQSRSDPNQAHHFDETDSAIPTIHEASEASRPGIQVPFHACVPIANN